MITHVTNSTNINYSLYYCPFAMTGAIRSEIACEWNLIGKLLCALHLKQNVQINSTVPQFLSLLPFYPSE